MISPANLKKSLTCFFMPLANRFFGGRVFFRFRTKKMRRGLRRQSSVFLHAIYKRIFWGRFFSFSHKKRNEKGGWDSSLTWFFLIPIHSYFKQEIIKCHHSTIALSYSVLTPILLQKFGFLRQCQKQEIWQAESLVHIGQCAPWLLDATVDPKLG